MAKSVIYNGYFRCRAACAQWRALGGSLQGWAHRRTWPAPLRVTGRDGACIRLEWARVADDGVGMSFTAPRMHAWPCCRASFRHGFVELQKRQNAPAAGKTGLIVQSNLGWYSRTTTRPRNRENRQSYKTPISPHLGFTAHPRDHGYVPVEGRTPNTILWRSTRPNVFGGLKPDCPEQSHTATTLPPHCQRTETTSGPWHG